MSALTSVFRNEGKIEFLTNYFKAMSEKGKLRLTDPRMQAFTFMMSQYGVIAACGPNEVCRLVEGSE